MKEILYTLAELCEQIEKVHGPITEPFVLRYPTDLRCKLREHVCVGGKDWSMMWHPAEEGSTVKELLGNENITGFMWRPEPGKILRIAVREPAA